MAKRFIDTNLFDDPWFMELSMSGKILWMYSITKCNHAGIFEINEKLCKFQTGIGNTWSTVRQEMGNRWLTVQEGKIFIPKFVEFQYPKGLHDNVLAQKSVMNELEKYDLWDSENQTVRQEIDNCCPTVKDIYKDKDKDKDKDKVVLPDFISRKLWDGFLEQRKKLKPPITDYAQTLAFTKLRKFKDEGMDIEVIIKNSIISGWKDFYEPKHNGPKDEKPRKPLTEDDVF